MNFESPYSPYGLITFWALFCFMVIFIATGTQSISKLEFKILTVFGFFSWVLQMWFISHLDWSREVTRSLFMNLSLTAMVCFIVIIGLSAYKIIGRRDLSQAILWGQFVFPLLLVTLMPNGIYTLLNLI